jgi:hypothetical protein|tara:strand:- start:2035 stop:2382 length:348 start_codon:yes stop_codon:yes gene_type:complete
MDEGMMMAVLGLCVLGVAFLAYRFEKSNLQLRHEIQQGILKIESKTLPDFPTLDELRDEVEDIIASSMGQMRTPQIADHLGAILQQWAQVKLAKEMQSMNPASMLESVTQAEDFE